jgi:hypothetical protein
MNAPNKHELELFALGGENAERRATVAYAGRVGISAGEARARLQEVVRLSRELLPYMLPEVVR